MKMKKNFLKTCGGLAAFFLLAGVAGHFDRLDEEVNEMKNNGSYWEMAESHPGLTDEELVELRDSIEEANRKMIEGAEREVKCDSVEGCGE